MLLQPERRSLAHRSGAEGHCLQSGSLHDMSIIRGGAAEGSHTDSDDSTGTQPNNAANAVLPSSAMTIAAPVTRGMNPHVW